MKHPLVNLLVRWSVLALGVILAAKIVPGIGYDGTMTLLAVVVLLSLFNAILRPILLLFTLPFIILTMGIGIVLINALLFLWVGKMVDGFQVDGFLSALGGSIIVSAVNMVLHALLKRNDQKPGPPPADPGRDVRGKPDDVIDI